MEVTENPTLVENIEANTPMKEWLIEYVGQKKTPENNEVTTAMIVEVMTKEFPEFLAAVAEENWIRGYQQAIVDVEEGEKILAKEMERQQKKEEEDAVEE